MKRKKLGRRGTTLVEIMIAILLMAIVTISMFTVAVSAKRVSGKTDRKMAAAQAARLLLERLKNYVSADTASAGVATLGPGPTGATWTMQGYAGIGYPLTEATNVNVTTMLPLNLRGAPYNMVMNYTVADAGANPGDANYRPTVTVNVSWTEPQ